MSGELLINVTPSETRVALIENGMLQEIFVERSNRRGLVGNIYKGRVNRVLPGMQAAFVDVGLSRAGFLHASDILVPARGTRSRAGAESAEEIAEPVPSEAEALAVGGGDAVALASAGDSGPDSANSSAAPAVSENGGRSVGYISELLREGQEILTQIIKEPMGTKGARLTTHIAIPSCYLVYLPDSETVGVSQRIEDETERQRLRELVVRFLAEQAQNASPAAGPTGGFIIRTAAENVPDELLLADMAFLRKLWITLQERSRTSRAPQVVHEDLPLVIRTMRELVGGDIERVRIDSRETYRRVVEFAQQFIPEMVARIEHYPGERPIFDLYAVEDEIQKSLERKVELKSGGYVILDQTEAMTTIDVNTGAYVGHRTQEETIFKTNLEAAQAIARQLRLRNLGGIIIIDFIDMESEDHKRQVLRALEKSLERDHTKTQISEVSSLGLVQMTRKRTRESLEHTLCEACPTCNGRGSVKTAETVCYEIFRELLREARQFDVEKLLVLASREVIDRLMEEESTNFAELETFVGKPITLQVEPLYTREQYDVVLM